MNELSKIRFLSYMKCDLKIHGLIRIPPRDFYRSNSNPAYREKLSTSYWGSKIQTIAKPYKNVSRENHL